MQDGGTESLIPQPAINLLEKELEIIGSLAYGGYFLTLHELVNFCAQENILCQGRGSAANSIVCFCLGITAADPLKMKLLFERFLSKERAEPPDIDLDIEHSRREEVIQYMYNSRGRRHAAMVANVVHYRGRSALREVGKALGFSEAEIDRATKLISSYTSEGIDEDVLLQAGFKESGLKKGNMTQLLVSLTNQLVGRPRHLSIHPGGFLLGDTPVDELVPVEPATMENRTVIQWDKYDVEALALFKVDLLGLGALNCVHRAFDLLREHESVDLDMASIPQEDPQTYAMISRGDTLGTFQIESRAQMAMLPRIKPKTFYDLVIEISVVRPGPIQGNMVHPYLKRRAGKEPVTYPHPALKEVLERTLGIPIFQEQVMQLAVLVGDYTPGQADQLRRDMAAWKRSGAIEKHYGRLVPAMIKNGISESLAENIFSQLRGFGEYGFPESHAISFALIAYITAWLRCHYPAIYACALINAQPMGFYSIASIIQDAKHHGVKVLPTDVKRSAWQSTIEKIENKSAIRMGLKTIKGLSEKDGKQILSAPKNDFDTWVAAAGLTESTLIQLARCGALESFEQNRRNALWKIHALAKHRNDSLRLSPTGTQLSFSSLCNDDKIVWDYRSSGYSTRGHPMRRYRKKLRQKGYPSAREVSFLVDKKLVKYIGVIIARQRPQTAKGIMFATLEDETGVVNLVVFEKIFEKYHVVAKTARYLEVSGHIQRSEEGIVHLIVDHMSKPNIFLETADDKGSGQSCPANSDLPKSHDFR